MKRNNLNRDQKLFVSDFLNGLSIAWFSAGAISPLFIKVDDILKLIIQMAGSMIAAVILFVLGLKNLSGK